MLQIVRQPYEASFSRNPVVFRFKVTPWTDNETEVNTVISVTLFAESEHYKNDFAEIKQYTLRPDADGFAEIDFAVLLDAQLRFSVPRLDTNLIQPCSSQGARYYIRYSLANDYEQVQAPLQSNILHVLKGGIAYEHWHPSTFFIQKIVADREVLRYSYEGEKIAADEPVWLYFIAPTEELGQSIQVEFQLQCDGVNTLAGSAVPSLTTLGQSLDLLKWRIYCVPIGIAQQALLTSGLLTGTQVLHTLRITIKVDGNDYTKTLDLEVDYRNHYETRTLHYFNSLGGFDTQVMRGQLDMNASYDKQMVTLLDTNAYATGREIKPAERQNDPHERAGIKGDTGFIEIERMERLRDLMNSTVAYENLGAKLKPISVPAGNMKLYTNKDKLYSLALDWQDAFQDRNFTPDNYMPGATCPAIEFVGLDQQVPRKPRVSWQLPEGYDTVQIAFFDSANGGVPPAIGLFPTLYLMAKGTTGSVDLDLPLGWTSVINATPFHKQIWVWARVVCDDSAATFSAGPWSASQNIQCERFIPPLAHNDFATSYKGAGNRSLTFKNNATSILANDQMRNNGVYLLCYLLVGNTTTQAYTTTGSAGGTFAINYLTGEVTYTPPSASFSGVDSVGIVVGEQIGVGQVSPPAYSKLYVTVATDDASTPLYAGKPYIKLYQFSGGSITSGGNTVEKTNLVASFWRDPFGKIPYDLTNSGLQFSISIKSIINNVTTTYADQVFNASGLDVTLTNTNTAIQAFGGGFIGQSTSAGDFFYDLIPSPNYFIL